MLTLVHSDKKRVYGIAYKIGKNVEKAFERLNFREKYKEVGILQGTRTNNLLQSLMVL